MATRIMASLVSGSRSWSTSSRLYRTSHPNVRSTTQRLGWIWNPFGALAVVVTRQLHARRTHATKRRLNPESAMTSRTRASSPRTGASSQHPPSRSCTQAGTTSNAHTIPSESTATNRLRPLVFFPRVVPLGSADMGRLHRLAIHTQRLGRRRRSSIQAHLLTQGGVDLVPHPGHAPEAEAGVDGLPGREVVGQHTPSRAGAEVVEQRVEDLTRVVGGSAALGTAGLGGRQQRLETLPLLVGEIGGVRFPFHAALCTPDHLHFQDTLSD